MIRAQIEGEKADAEAQLAKTKREQVRYASNTILDNQWLVKYRAFRSCETPTKEMIQTLIHHIELTPMTNDVEIIFNFVDDFKELQQIMDRNGGTADAQ